MRETRGEKVVPENVTSKSQRRRTGKGFTLVEVIIGGSLTLLLFLGAVDLYVASAQITVQSGAACYATTDAANAVQHIVRDAEEAHWLALPEDTWWTSPAGQASSAFQTTSGSSLLDTGVELIAPASGSGSVSGGNGSTLSIPDYDRTAFPITTAPRHPRRRAFYGSTARTATGLPTPPQAAISG